MNRTTRPSQSSEPSPAGRVIFYGNDPAGNPDEDYLFFIPLEYSKALKALEGSMWFKINNPAHGIIYRATSSVEAIQWLRDTLGLLKISREVKIWFDRNTLINPIQPIDGLPLFEFQLRGAGFLRSRSRAMLSLSPGLGKTITSIVAATKLKFVNRVLVVAPVSLLYMWKSELKKWEDYLPKKFEIFIWHKEVVPQQLKNPPQGIIQWVITNPETLNNRIDIFKKRGFQIMILDESILYKNRGSKRTKNVLSLAKNIPYVWELTGAPANKMVDDLWSQFHILKPKAYSSYWRFSDEYCLTSNAGWGKKVLANTLGSEEKIKTRFKDIYFAVSQSEVLNIPEWIFEDIDIPMTTVQQKIYKDLATDLLTRIKNDDGTVNIIAVGSHLEKVIRLIQAASNPFLFDGPDESGKWKAIEDLVDYFPKPFIFWTSFIKTNHSLTSKLGAIGMNVGSMLGETKPQDRQNVIDRFQANKLDAIVVGQAVGSFGHTLTAARTAFYPERTFDGSYFQSLYRFRRIGTVLSPVVVNLMSVYEDGSKTIDHLVNSLLDYRVQMIRNLTTGMLRDIL